MTEPANHAQSPVLRSSETLADIEVRLDKLYVTRAVDGQVRAAVHDMIRLTRKGPEGRAVVLVGDSRAGKSTLMRRMLRGHPELSSTVGAPDRLIEVQVPGPCTLRELGRRVCHAAGYPYQGRAYADVVWAKAHDVIRSERIGFIHFSEIQNTMETANVYEAMKLRNTIKTLLIDEAHRIGLILTGQRSIVSFLSADNQMTGRTAFVETKDIGEPDYPILVDAITKMAEIADVAVPTDLAGRIMPRLSHAALRQFGRALEIARAAIFIAIAPRDADGERAAGGAELTIIHFADAYAARTGNAAFANPFLSPRWEGLDCSMVMVTDPNQLTPRADPPPRPRPRRVR